MALSDHELFDFNAALMGDYDDEKAHEDLKKHGDAFRYQLVAALHLDQWAERLQDDPESLAAAWLDEKELRGYINALHEIAAQLRQGSYLPGGTFYEDVDPRP